MNLRQPYEQLIADKLRKLPAPDVNTSWQQMKRLLDDNEDRGGDARRPPGNKGWWRIGAVVIALTASLWFYADKKDTHAPLAKNNKTVPSVTNIKPAATESRLLKNSTGNNKTNTIDKNITLNGLNKPVAAEENNTSNPPSVKESNLAGNLTNTTAASNSYTNDRIAQNNKSVVNKPVHLQKAESLSMQLASGKKSVTEKSSVANLQHDAIENNSDAIAGIQTAGKNKNDAAGNLSNKFANGHTGIPTDNNFVSPHSFVSGHAAGKLSQSQTKNSTANNNSNNNPGSDRYFPLKQTEEAKEKDWFATIAGLKHSGSVPSANISLAVTDTAGNRTSSLLNNETKKQIAKAQRDKEIEDLTRKQKKSFHLDLSNVFKPFSLHVDTDPRWAAGISLNSAVTMNAQSRFNYNMNGKSGTLTDYIPSVYLQFHLNNYVYAQTEINFISPQYTPQLLVYQQNNNVAAMTGVSDQKSIYIQKLYYFNLPITLHYSPINNFYFSAGLQFSSLQSGLVSVQEKQYPTASGPDHATNVSNTVVKFKDDSIAAKLSPSEWRWQAGAEYYWNRFTIGVRYNRSFKDILNVNLSNSLPATTLRNEALIFSVRYNLFESRKKGEQSQKN